MSLLESLSLQTIPPEDEALRQEVRQFLQKTIDGLPASERAKTWSGYSREFSLAMGKQGLIGITLPKQYGGAGKSAFARFVVLEECLSMGAPVGSHWIADRQSAPLILRYGTEAQKQAYVPGICRGELGFCIGMSEPNSGSDLASIRSTARRNDNGWLLNGQKIWTTFADKCEYMIALVRTSGTPEDRRQGLSQLVIDLSLPGITIRPITDLSGDGNFSEVFFDNVQLAEDALIGQEGQGWEQVTAELAFERSGPERLLSSIVLFDEWRKFINTSQGDSPESRQIAGQVLAKLTPLRAMSVALTEKLSRGESPVIEAALVKELGTTLEQQISTLIADDLYRREPQHIPAELLRTLDLLIRISPSFSLRGGTRDILRGMIARGLGLR